MSFEGHSPAPETNQVPTQWTDFSAQTLDTQHLHEQVQALLEQMDTSIAKQRWEERFDAFQVAIQDNPENEHDEYRKLLADLEAIDDGEESSENPAQEEWEKPSEIHKGGGIDNALSASEIQQRIDALEDQDNLTHDQRKELFFLKKQLIALENQAQAENEATIETKNENLNMINEIKIYLDDDIRQKFPDLDALLAPTDELLTKEKLTDADDAILKESLTETLNYLKAPQNEDELLSIYRGMQNTNSETADGFRNFLENQDAAFKPIFERFDSQAQTSHEATIAAGLPSDTTLSGNPSSGYSTQIEDGMNVHMKQAGDGFERNITFGDASIKTPTHEVDISKDRTEYDNTLQELWPQKQLLEQAIKFIDDNPNLEIGEIHAMLQAELGEQYNALEISDMTQASEIKQYLQWRLGETVAKLEHAQKKFDAAVKNAITEARKQYEATDRLTKQALKLKYNTGFSLLPKSVSNQVVETINRDPWKYGFNGEIDFTRGLTGTNKTTDSGVAIENADMIAFAEKVNIMLGTELVDVSAIERGMTGVPNRDSFETQLRIAGMQETGAAHRILQNLLNAKNESHWENTDKS